MWAIAAWRSSRFLPEIRSSSPWIAACTLSLLSLSPARASWQLRSMPWRSVAVWRSELPEAFSALEIEGAGLDLAPGQVALQQLVHLASA